MGNKKDIGDFLKNRLETAKKTPDESLWGKINDSLDKKEERKKKRPFFLISFLGILGILIYFIFQHGSKPQIKNANSIEVETTNENSKEKNTDPHSNNSIEKSDFLKDSLKTSIGTEFKTTNENNDQINTGLSNESHLRSPKKRASHNNFENPVDNPLQSNKKGKILKETKKTTARVERESGKNTLKEELKSKISQIKKDSLPKNNLDIVDSIGVVKTQSNKKSIKESTKKDTTKIEQERKGKWAITVFGGPTYFDISKKHSIVDNSFDGRKTFGELRFSYGLGVSAPLTERLSVSYAILRTKMAYSVKNIPSSTPQDFSRILSYSAIFNDNLVTEQELSEFNGTGNSLILMHEIEYIEMPLQLSYSLLQGKFGIHGLIGFSTLLLQNNAIFAENSRGGKLKLGSANNLLKINLSLNAGVGVHYNLSKRIRIALDPTFKYYFYISDKQNTSCFLLGVYGGINYNFNLN